MSVQFPGPDPLEDEIRRVLDAIEAHAEGRLDGTIERQRVDLKEEAGRRGSGGAISGGGLPPSAASGAPRPRRLALAGIGESEDGQLSQREPFGDL